MNHPLKVGQIVNIMVPSLSKRPEFKGKLHARPFLVNKLLEDEKVEGHVFCHPYEDGGHPNFIGGVVHDETRTRQWSWHAPRYEPVGGQMGDVANPPEEPTAPEPEPEKTLPRADAPPPAKPKKLTKAQQAKADKMAKEAAGQEDAVTAQAAAADAAKEGAGDAVQETA